MARSPPTQSEFIWIEYINKYWWSYYTFTSLFCFFWPRGERNVLQRRLKIYYKKVKNDSSAGSAAAATVCGGQCVDYFCVVDFEATCWVDQDFQSAESEIIEFPAVLLNARSLEREAEFHSYCRPTISPLLSDFCESLTGISQVGTVESWKWFQTVKCCFSSCSQHTIIVITKAIPIWFWVARGVSRSDWKR